MPVAVLFPAAGWLALLLPLLWWSAPRPRRRAAVAIRAAIGACVILAMTQPVAVRRGGPAPHVYVLDQRVVLPAATRAAAEEALRRLLARSGDGPRTVVRIGGGSLSAALDRALAALPAGAGGAITWIGDPHSTDAHWQAGLAALVRRGIRFDAVMLAPEVRRAILSDLVSAPVRVGEAASVTASIEPDGQSHALALWSGARRLATATLAPGEATATLRFPATGAGFVPLRATLDGGGFPGGAMTAVAAVQDPLPLLYLGSRQTGAVPRLQRLLGSGFRVTAGDPAASDPGGAALVMLDDVPAARLPAATQRRLMQAIAGRGAGLIASGGRAAFGPGGYAGAPLAAALPVVPRQDDRVERPSIALAVVIDTSGSMAGEPLDLAKQVARQTVRKLTPADRVGVVEFYGAKQWAVPMQQVRDTADVERAIGRMQAQGASMLFPALQEAYYGLKDLDARYKHILVISDGGVAEDRYQQLLRHVADDRINVSTVMIGDDASGEQSMADWARIGRGRFYQVADEFGLVAIDFSAPQPRPQPGYRPGATPLVPAPDASWWSGTGIGTPPALGGYARTRARPEAQTLLATGGGDPILASWQFGSGRVTALATEPLGEGTRTWQGWRDYGRWLARVAAITARQRPAVDLSIERRFDHVRVSAQRFDTRDAAPLVLRRVDADGHAIGTALPAEERAPGLFVADLTLPSGVPALFIAQDATAIVRAADRAASDRAPVEAMRARLSLPMRAIAARTGGRFRDDPAAAPGPVATARAPVAVELWPWLALLALGLYLFDIAWRRRPRLFPRGPRP